MLEEKQGQFWNIQRIVLNIQRIVLNIQRIVLNIQRIVLNIQQIVLNIQRIDLNIQRIVFNIQRIVLNILRAVLPQLTWHSSSLRDCLCSISAMLCSYWSASMASFRRWSSLRRFRKPRCSSRGVLASICNHIRENEN